jgi:hypothetical protein
MYDIQLEAEKDNTVKKFVKDDHDDVIPRQQEGGQKALNRMAAGVPGI